MPITLNVQTINTCDNTTGVTSTSGLTASTIAIETNRKEGTGSIDLESTGTGLRGATFTISPAIDLRTTEISCWFFNPGFSDDGARILGDVDSDLRLRVYNGGGTSANYAEFDQSQLKFFDGQATRYPTLWSILRCSGDAGQETRTNGTWTTTQASSVDAVAVIFGQTADSAAGFLGQDTPFLIDFVKAADKIIVTGDNSGTPWTFQDIYNADQTNAWGLVQKRENFYTFFCGLEFGDGTTGSFADENVSVFFDHSSKDHAYDITIKNNFTVTLGEKNIGTSDTYAQDGVIIRASENGIFDSTSTKVAPAFTVESGGILQAYATTIAGYGTVNLGSGGSGVIELVGVDLYDNNAVEFRSTGLTADNIRVHQLSTDKGDLGTIFNVPVSMSRIQVFNSNDALEFRESFSVNQYIASDNTFDVVILEGEEMVLQNSSFNTIKRTT
jgi:hypothetical protein